MTPAFKLVNHASLEIQNQVNYKLQITTRNVIIDFVNENEFRGFAGGTVLKNPPANAEETGSSPGPGRSHMPRSS